MSISSSLIKTNVNGQFNTITNNNNYYIAASNANSLGIYYSINYGENWSQTNITTGTFTLLSMNSSGNCIAASGSSLGIYWSSNSGQTWTRSTSGGTNLTGNFNYVTMNDNGQCIASSVSNGLWGSTDNGINWVKYSNYETNTFYQTYINNNGTNAVVGGTNVLGYTSTIQCFNEDTKILMLNESNEQVYIPIKNIKVGDLIKTYKTGFIPVKYIRTKELLNSKNNKLLRMYRMKNTEIIVTGGHAILVDELSEKQKENQEQIGFYNTLYDKNFLLACFSDDFEELPEIKLYNIYHLVLENNDPECHFGIYCENNVLTESCPENFLLSHMQ